MRITLQPQITTMAAIIDAPITSKESAAINELANRLDMVKVEYRWQYALTYHLNELHQLRSCPTLVLMQSGKSFQVYQCTADGRIKSQTPITTLNIDSWKQ